MAAPGRKQTVVFREPPSVLSFSSIGGKNEAEGPLSKYFDELRKDSYFGEKTYEKAESAMQRIALARALEKGGITPADVDFVFAGDLLNQCISSSFSLRGFEIPFFGLYGACSTMGEGLSLAAALIAGGFADCAAALTSSHFCTAERQYRTPMPYGSQRAPTSQWTVTGSGCCILTKTGGGPYIRAATCGKIADRGITDMNNMGAAMAPAAYSTLSAHFRNTHTQPADYDLIVTGDLGRVGKRIVTDMFRADGWNMEGVYDDCGALIFDAERQDMHAGGSGCGCSASVLCGYILRGMRGNKWKKVLFAPTGALMSPTSCCQGESIPGICHAITISNSKDD
jgi:stage V sporulation protein AD